MYADRADPLECEMLERCQTLRLWVCMTDVVLMWYLQPMHQAVSNSYIWTADRLCLLAQAQLTTLCGTLYSACGLEGFFVR